MCVCVWCQYVAVEMLFITVSVTVRQLSAGPRVVFTATEEE